VFSPTEKSHATQYEALGNTDLASRKVVIHVIEGVDSASGAILTGHNRFNNQELVSSRRQAWPDSAGRSPSFHCGCFVDSFAAGRPLSCADRRRTNDCLAVRAPVS
jgi:hypothetical protein